MTWTVAGDLSVVPALDAPALLAAPVRAALGALGDGRCGVTEIDPALADTAALCEHYGVPLDASANCVVVTGRRAGEQRWAACVVLATTRADINNTVRRRLDVRKASFASQDETVSAPAWSTAESHRSACRPTGRCCSTPRSLPRRSW